MDDRDFSGPPQSSGGTYGDHAETIWREIQIDLNRARTEFERYRILENATVCHLAAIRCSAHKGLIRLGLSILKAKYHTNQDIKKDLEACDREFKACRTGFVTYEPEAAYQADRATLYTIKVQRDGVPIGAKESKCLPEQLHIVVPEVREDYYMTLECQYEPISTTLRTMLVQVEWLKEEFGPQDPDEREATRSVRSREYGRERSRERN
jgi:hypothetical protein